MLKWFYGYLNNRAHCVCINNQLSDLLPITSDVPQGSILGPLFFALYINDLPDSITFSKSLLYADDTKCFKTVSSCWDTLSLQQDLNQSFSWSVINFLLFHEKNSLFAFLEELWLS